MFLITLCFIWVLFCLYWMERLQSLPGVHGMEWLEGNEHWKKAVKKCIWAFIGGLTLISAVRHGFVDTYAYREMYRYSHMDLDYVQSGAGWGIEYGWLYTCYLLNYICTSPNFILLLSALLINYAYVNSIRMYSEDTTFSLWMFFCLLWLDTNNGLRQFAASALIIMALPLLVNQERSVRRRVLGYIGFIGIVLLAMQWHNSAKLLFPVMIVVLGKPMNWRTWLSMLVCLSFIYGMESAKDVFVLGSGETSKYAEMYLGRTSGGMGIPRSIFMGFIPLFFAVCYYLKCRRNRMAISYVDGVLLNLLMMQVAFTFLGLKIQILARLCFYTYFAYFLIMPKLMKSFFGRNYKNARLVAIGCLLFFFWYNVYRNFVFHSVQDFYYDVEF